MNTVKMKLCEHLSEADSSLSPQNTHVLPSSDEQMWKYDTSNLPIITVRIGPSKINEPIQGRQLGGGKWGNFVNYFFTAHIFAKINETEDEDTIKTAMDLADNIEEHLLRSKDDTTGIAYYYEITKRESPVNMARVMRVIVEGYIYCRKPFKTEP